MVRKSRKNASKGVEKVKREHKKRGRTAWIDAVVKARHELDIKGFVAVKKGTKLYETAMRHYKGASDK